MSKSDTKHTFVDRCFKDKDGKVVLAQRPNVPILLWAFAQVLSMVVRHGIFHSVLRDIAQAALFIWAVLEVALGINYFRRLLGLVILVALVTSAFK